MTSDDSKVYDGRGRKKVDESQPNSASDECRVYTQSYECCVQRLGRGTCNYVYR
jgi:hypothetical protein